MLEDRATHATRRRSQHPPFARILCAVDGSESDTAAVEQAIAVAGTDARITFAASWYGTASPSRAASSEERALDALEQALARGRAAGANVSRRLDHAPRLGEALLAATAMYDLVIAGARRHSRISGILLGETATLLVHRAAVGVLIARERPLAAGIVAATRERPADRPALTVAAHLAARLEAELTVVHVSEPGDGARRPELMAELANARALLGRDLHYVTDFGSPVQAIAGTAEDAGAGLVVVGSAGKRGVAALGSVSERLAHLAPCSVLALRTG